MNNQIWEPDLAIGDLLIKANLRCRGISIVTLFDLTKFVLNEKFWMLGISLTKKKVLFHPRILDYPIKYQAQKIVHELTHSAQRVDKSPMFNLLYFLEWVKAGFSYERMKKFGFEREAIKMEYAFKKAISS